MGEKNLQKGWEKEYLFDNSRERPQETISSNKWRREMRGTVQKRRKGQLRGETGPRVGCFPRKDDSRRTWKGQYDGLNEG